MVGVHSNPEGSTFSEGITFSHIRTTPDGVGDAAAPCGVGTLNSAGAVRYNCRPNRSLPMQRAFPLIAAAVLLAASASAGDAADVKILTAGAMKAVVLELVPAFEK